MSNVVNDFNKTLLDLAEQISLVCPNSILSNNLTNIRMIINNFPNKIIDVFCVYVLIDKDRIDSGDKDYFLNKSYDNAFDDKNSSTQ